MKLSKLIIVLLSLSILFACSINTPNELPTDTPTENPGEDIDKPGEDTDNQAEVYFLNVNSQIAGLLERTVAPAFEAETGIKLKVVTPGYQQYKDTLKSELEKGNPPAIFQLFDSADLAAFRANLAALDNTTFYSLLADKSMALSIDGKVAAIPYFIEGYGIIYNEAIMEKYFALSGAKVSSMAEINNFATLKAVVEDMQARRDELGIKGVFASTSFGPSEDWRWQTHLMNIALYDEFKTTADTLAAKELQFTGADNFKALFDLYINNSLTDPSELDSKTVDDSMAEFALGQCAMVQNGNWCAAHILGVPGNKVAKEDIKFLPLYAGLDGEENLGLCVGTLNYICINSHISAEDQANADKFLTWLFSSATGKKFVSETPGFITPFNSFAEDELPDDPLAKEVNRWTVKEGITSIPCCFIGIPSDRWKAAFGGELLQYIQGGSDWASCVKVAQEAWAKEAAIAGR